ncbi:MAG: hypothetical protein AAFP92_19560, partial [Bacteroidota bacterium]
MRFSLFLLGLLIALPGFSATITSVSSGNWNTAATWDSGTVPTSADDVIIDEGHTISSAPSMNFLTLTISGDVNGGGNGVLNHNGGAFNGTGSFTNDGLINITASMTLSGTLTNNGQINWNGGGLFGSGGSQNLDNFGLIFVNAINQNVTDIVIVVKNGALLRKQGTLNLAQALAALTVEAGGTVEVAPNSALQVLGPVSHAGDMVVSGFFRLQDGSFASVAGNTISGTGVFEVAGANTASGADISVGTGSISMFGGSSFTGSAGQDLVVPAGTQLNTTGATTLDGFDGITVDGILFQTQALNLGSDLTNNGSYTWNGGGIFSTVGGTSLTNTGTIFINAINQGTTDMTFVNQSGGLIRKQGTLNQAQALTDLVNEAGGTVEVAANSALQILGTLSNAGSIDVGGFFRVQGAATTVVAGSSIAGSGIFEIVGANTTSGADLEIGTNGISMFGLSSLTGSAGQDFIVATGATLSQGTGNTTLEGFDGITIDGGFIQSQTLNLGSDITNNGFQTWNGGGIISTVGGTTITNFSTIFINAINQATTDITVVNKNGALLRKQGTLNQSQALTDVVNEAGGSIEVAANSALWILSTLSNAGSIDVGGFFRAQDAALTVVSGSSIIGSGIFEIVGAVTTSGSDLVLGTNLTRAFGGSSLTGSAGQSFEIPSGSTLETFGGNNTYTGFDAITINGSFLQNQAINLGSDINILGTYTWNGGAITSTVGGTTITNSGSIFINAINQVLTDISHVNQSGGLIRKQGTLNQQQTLSSLTNEAGGSIEVAANSALWLNGALSNEGSINIGGIFRVQGAAVTILAGSSIFGTGLFEIVGAATASGEDLSIGSNSIRIFGGAALTGSAGQNFVVETGSTMDILGGSVTMGGFDGMIIDGTFLHSQTFTIQSAITNNGTYTWTGGAMIGSAGGTTFTNGGTINLSVINAATTDMSYVNQNGGVISKTGSSNQNQTLSNLTNEVGGVINIASNSSLSFSGNSENNGQVNNSGLCRIFDVLNGSGSFTGNAPSVEANATLAPGQSPGCMTFANGPVFAQNTSTFSVDVSGTTPCSGYDQITSSGTVTLNGVLEANIGSFSPPTGTVITLIDANAISGTFSSISPALPTDWNLQYDIPNGEVSLQYTGVPATFDVTIGNLTAGPNNTFTLPVTVANFNNVAAFQGTVSFDDNDLSVSNVTATSALTNAGFNMSFGQPGVGSVPNNAITFAAFETNVTPTSLPDNTVIFEIQFTVASGASTGSSSVSLDGSVVPLGFTNGSSTTLAPYNTTSGTVTIDADPPVVLTANLASNNANTNTLATVGDDIILSFTTDEAPAVTPVVSIDKGGAALPVVGGSGTVYTATKSVASGDDGVVTFSITVEDQYGNQSTTTATTDASSVTVDTELPEATDLVAVYTVPEPPTTGRAA